MKTALALAGAALLAGCADVPRGGPGPWGPQAAPRSWGYERGQQAPALISEAEAQTLTEQVTSLKAQRSTPVNNLPRVTDPARRSEHVRGIDETNRLLQQLEYRLRAAGRPVPR